MYRYWIESTKGTHVLLSMGYRAALQEARAWQREHQAAYADLCGPRGGRRRI